MTAALESQISRLSRSEKIALADRLLADTELHAKPPGLRRADDPGVEAELRRRLADKTPGAWLTLAEFRAKADLR
ncbi:MAG: hypothetical protein RLZZ15_1175 [Verrucomicrobiota bacterium]|jgi:hypothetical protein